MNGSRMKQLLLRFLVVCNLILLAVIAAFGVSGKLRIQEQNQQLMTLLERRGVRCGSSVYEALLEEKNAYTVHTDTAAQEAFCTSFLGAEVTAEARSGGSIVWSGERGSIEWTRGGSVSGTVDWPEQTIPADMEDAERQISSYMKQAGIDIGQTAFATVQDPTGYIIRVQEGVDGKNLEGCEMKFELSREGVLTISGRWCFGEPEKIVMDELDDSSPEDILLSLINQDSGITEIIRAQRVYVLSDKSGNRFTILPCWRITTDQGAYVIDPLTGLPAESTEEDDTTPFENQPEDSSTQDELRPDTGTTPSDGEGDSDWITAESDGGDAADDTASTELNPDADEGETSETDPELPDKHGVYG